MAPAPATAWATVLTAPTPTAAAEPPLVQRAPRPARSGARVDRRRQRLHGSRGVPIGVREPGGERAHEHVTGAHRRGHPDRGPGRLALGGPTDDGALGAARDDRDARPKRRDRRRGTGGIPLAGQKTRPVRIPAPEERAGAPLAAEVDPGVGARAPGRPAGGRG